MSEVVLRRSKLPNFTSTSTPKRFEGDTASFTSEGGVVSGRGHQLMTTFSVDSMREHPNTNNEVGGACVHMYVHDDNTIYICTSMITF